MYLDVHCHLDLCNDIDNAVKESRDAGVKIIITNGTGIESNRRVLEIMKEYKVDCALGLYPIESIDMNWKEIDNEIEFIRKNRGKIMAIGEVGLDLKETSEIGKQKEVFIKIINLSNEIDKPLIVHSRKAERECIDILKEKKAKKVIMHCFSGSMKLVDEIVENGWYLSIPANIEFSEHFQKVVERVPIENLLCETDSPYLHPKKEQNNIPKNVIYSYKKIANIKKIDDKEVQRKIETNFKKLFLNEKHI